MGECVKISSRIYHGTSGGDIVLSGTGPGPASRPVYHVVNILVKNWKHRSISRIIYISVYPCRIIIYHHILGDDRNRHASYPDSCCQGRRRRGRAYKQGTAVNVVALDHHRFSGTIRHRKYAKHPVVINIVAENGRLSGWLNFDPGIVQVNIIGKNPRLGQTCHHDTNTICIVIRMADHIVVDGGLGRPNVTN